MSDGLVRRILYQADAAIVDFVHARGILRNIACRAPLQNDNIQGRPGGYFLRHDQTAPSAADDDYVCGFKAFQPDTILSPRIMKTATLVRRFC
jgi:hypothetical protein